MGGDSEPGIYVTPEALAKFRFCSQEAKIKMCWRQQWMMLLLLPAQVGGDGGARLLLWELGGRMPARLLLRGRGGGERACPVLWDWKEGGG